MKAGWIGLGAMGQGMAQNLAKSGYLAAVYNRTPGKTDNFLDVSVCPNPQSLAIQVDVVCICVSADQDVLEMVTAISSRLIFLTHRCPVVLKAQKTVPWP